MSALGLVKTTVPVLETGAPTPPGPQLRLEDALASARRLWVRGRLSGLAELPREMAAGKGWWDWWRGRPAPEPVLPPVQLETRISGSVLATAAPLLPGGRFEALFSTPLPAARRGWRVARNRVTWAGHTLEACGVVLAPPADSGSAVIVVLPADFSFHPGGAQRLAGSESASRLTGVLQSLHRAGRGYHPIYYLGCVPLEGETHQAELALAVTSLGWPAGNFVLLPAVAEAIVATLAVGLDRLRWLFAGDLDQVVLNLEPQVAASLAAQLTPVPDRAVVRRLVNPEDDPRHLFDAAAPQIHLSISRPTRSGLVPRYPVVFCHGMLATSMLRMSLPENANYFALMRNFFRERGFHVLFPQVPPTSGVIERAASLREQIRRWTEEPVNLIAHSMGGLDARYLIARLDMADRVRSLTTVSTPHRGTYVADWFLANFRQRVPLLLALEAFGVNVDGFQDCRLETCREFNENVPNSPKVRYFSYGGDVPQSKVSPMLRRSWSLLAAVEGANDGLVSAGSARWGDYLGTVRADHFAQTPDAVFIRPGEDFDSLGFFSRLVEDLARRGF